MKTSGTFHSDLTTAILEKDSDFLNIVGKSIHADHILEFRKHLIDFLVVQIDKDKALNDCEFDQVVDIVTSKYAQVMYNTLA